MRVTLFRISGLIFIVFIIFLTVITTLQDFTPFEYAVSSFEETLVPANQVTEAVSFTMWNQRQLDLIALSFLLFISATCCVAILRIEKGESR